MNEESKKILKSGHFSSKISLIIIILICMGPNLWLLWNAFVEPLSRGKITFVSIMNIPCMLLVGYLIGQKIEGRDADRYAQEADALEAELNELKSKSSK